MDTAIGMKTYEIIAMAKTDGISECTPVSLGSTTHDTNLR